MEHSTPLITILAAGFSMALAFGFIAERLKSPALLGYLIAGILIGPGSPGFTADVELGKQLSEIGVMLLMFGVGLHFSTSDLMAVKKIAVPGAIGQMLLATLFGIFVAKCWGWSWGASLVLGLSLSCASTVVVLKLLEAKDLLNSIQGKIAIGWLVVEDLVTVLFLVLLPPIAPLLGGDAGTTATTTKSIWLMIGETLLQVSAFIAVMLIAGRRFLPWALLQVAKTGSRELFTLAVIASAIGIAYLSTLLFNVSAALGAFFAGMVMRESAYSHRAAEESLPLRDAFSVLFFVSVGMLVDPKILIQQPLHVLGIIFIVVIYVPVVACAIVLLFRYPLNTAMTIGACLAQIGEFSFILAGLGVSLGLFPAEGLSLILAGALISIAVNPLIFASVPKLKQWILERSEFARKLEMRQDPFSELPMQTERKFLEGQVVLVGYGVVGQSIAQALTQQEIPFVIVDQNREKVEKLRQEDLVAVAGDATEASVLIQAHIANAVMLVIATPHPLNMRNIADIAKTLNPKIEIIVRTEKITEITELETEESKTWKIFSSQDSLANSMIDYVVHRFAPLEKNQHRKKISLEKNTDKKDKNGKVKTFFNKFKRNKNNAANPENTENTENSENSENNQQK